MEITGNLTEEFNKNLLTVLISKTHYDDHDTRKRKGKQKIRNLSACNRRKRKERKRKRKSKTLEKSMACFVSDNLLVFSVCCWGKKEEFSFNQSQRSRNSWMKWMGWEERVKKIVSVS